MNGGGGDGWYYSSNSGGGGAHGPDVGIRQEGNSLVISIDGDDYPVQPATITAEDIRSALIEMLHRLPKDATLHDFRKMLVADMVEEKLKND